jgi:guanine deaminase
LFCCKIKIGKAIFDFLFVRIPYSNTYWYAQWSVKEVNNMCDNHRHFMQAAIDEAEKNLQTNDGGPFGAVIVKDGKIIARGHNEVLKNNDPTCHAEMQTIRAACEALGTFDLSGCELYTSCYPCPMCLPATIWANIKTVYYGNTAKDAADIGFRDDYIYDFIKGNCVDESVMKISPCGRDETIVTFKKFMDKNDKKMY